MYAEEEEDQAEQGEVASGGGRDGGYVFCSCCKYWDWDSQDRRYPFCPGCGGPWCNNAESPLNPLLTKGKWLRVVPSLLESLVPGPGGWEDGDKEATAARVRDHLEGKAGSNLAPMPTCQNFRDSFEALPGMEDSNVDLHQ